MRKYKFIYSFIAICLLEGAVYGQGISLTFIDSQTNKPVVGMVVLLQSNGNNASAITDKFGQAQISPDRIPASIITKHINYDPLVEKNIKSNRILYVNPNAQTLSDVVIYSEKDIKTSIDPNLFVINEIKSQAIAQMGANNAADILNFANNVSITQEVGTGRSTVSLFGLSGEYVKILVDNVPLVSDNGLGNDIDISQINLDNIERIEVVEGAMGVLYGANAVAGVINIVTKENSARLKVTAYVQEETVGNEYNWTDEGRHIQSVQVNLNPNGPFTFSGNVNHNEFNGFWNDKKGKNYFGTGEIRGYEWNPKEQLRALGKLKYDLFSIGKLSYQLDYYQGDIDIYSSSIQSKLGLGGIPDYTAIDQRYFTQRFKHDITSNLKFNKSDLQFWLSYQRQARYNEAYVYDIERQIKTESSNLNKDQSSDVVYSKLIFNHKLPNTPRLKIATGYEYDYQQGYDAIASGAYSDSVAINNLWNVDIFGMGEWAIAENISTTPGLRINRNSNFGYQYIWSNSLNYSHGDYNLKFIVGSANKTPNYTQLYLYFVDANHDVTGNPNLDPEKGASFLLNLGKTTKSNSFLIKNELALSHFNISDKIDLATIVEDNPESESSIVRSTYINIHNYKTLGIGFNNNVSYETLNIGTNLSYIGVNQSLADDDGKYKYTLTINSNLSYELRQTKTLFSANLKYTGENQRYVQDGRSTSLTIIDPYTLINTSISQPVLNNALTITLGARNLTNIINVNTNTIDQSTGAHGSQSSEPRLFAYGRSYFLKLTYSFENND